jgi:hypothetical protein
MGVELNLPVASGLKTAAKHNLKRSYSPILSFNFRKTSRTNGVNMVRGLRDLVFATLPTVFRGYASQNSTGHPEKNLDFKSALM